MFDRGLNTRLNVQNAVLLCIVHHDLFFYKFLVLCLYKFPIEMVLVYPIATLSLAESYMGELIAFILGFSCTTCVELLKK